jgi:transcriptional regulator with XRE-family HTH domain
MPPAKATRTSGPEYREMGDRLRVERRARGLSLRELADRLGVSPSLISQVETGRARPSVSTLYTIANELGVSLDELLFADRRNGQDGDDTPTATHPRAARTNPLAGVATVSPVQRPDTRKIIRLASGVTWERLTANAEPGVDFLYVTYDVGGASGPEHEFQRHVGHEWGYVLSGTLGVHIGFDEYVLVAGDAISIDSTVPHRLYNIGDVPVHGIWIVVGRQSAPDHAASTPTAAVSG